MKVRQPLRIGLVGAGAIAQHAYLPELTSLPYVALTSIIETDPAVLESLSKKYEPEYLGPDLHECFGHIDAAIVAVPNHLHSPITTTLLSAGKHVLCEKPLTISSKEGKYLIDLADERSLVLAVALVRRYYPAACLIKKIIDSCNYGCLMGFNIEEGTVFSWPTVSGFFFNKVRAGGGVLMDIGVHLLDLLLWWIPGQITELEYHDDNLGGVEAFAEINLGFSSDIHGSVKVSRLSVLKNMCTLQFEKGDIVWNPMSPGKLFLLQPASRHRCLLNRRKTTPVRDMLSDFVCAVQDSVEPPILGRDTLAVIEVIERCYRSRRSLSLPWLFR